MDIEKKIVDEKRTFPKLEVSCYKKSQFRAQIYNNLKIVHIILYPAKILPFIVPEIFDSPSLFL